MLTSGTHMRPRPTPSATLVTPSRSQPQAPPTSKSHAADGVTPRPGSRRNDSRQPHPDRRSCLTHAETLALRDATSTVSAMTEQPLHTIYRSVELARLVRSASTCRDGVKVVFTRVVPGSDEEPVERRTQGTRVRYRSSYTLPDDGPRGDVLNGVNGEDAARPRRVVDVAHRRPSENGSARHEGAAA